ncbi:MAG TPA: peptidase, partial [Gemmatimonadaceae bacterium]|nr:peptidase [Gemmatimonadaceae bacterium]
YWTANPKRIAELSARMGQGGAATAARDSALWAELRSPALRDPRGYIIPADQADFITATKFVESLMKTGVTVNRASRAFTVAGKQYPAGSYVVKTAQAFRPHVIDMFEPQDHPNDFAYPGGPPIRPYDNAGWTLAYQMGVQFDRVIDAFDGPFEVITEDLPTRPAGRIVGGPQAAGYYLSHAPNDAFVAINRLLKNREDVYWLTSSVSANGKTYPAGTLYIASKNTTRPVLETLARDVGLTFEAVAAKPAVDAMKLNPIRVGLWDTYGGSMPSGWTRWLLEQFEFPFEVVYPPALDAGNLKAKYDVLIFPTGAIPAAGGGGGGFGGGGGGGGQNPQSVPAEFRDRVGRVSADQTIPQLRQFLEQGGTILAIGSSTSLAQHLGLPISDHLVEKQPDGTTRRLDGDKYYIPGSVLRVSVDNSAPLAHGMSSQADVFFNNSPVFRLAPDAALRGVRPVAWFGDDSPLRSGWAWGQTYLEGGVAVAEADVGRGKVFLYGPEVLFRAQPHGTFKLVFNGLYYPSATSARP